MNVKRMKRFGKCILPAMIAGVLFTGCVSTLEYTEEQQDMIADYAANVVLRHDERYKNNYLETMPETIPTTEAPTFGEDTTYPTQSGASGQENETKPYQDGTMSDVLGLESLTEAMSIGGLQAEYLDYYVSDCYPFDDPNALFVMNAVPDSKLLILKFRLSNPTSGDIAINMMGQNRRFRGIINEVTKTNAQLSLLLDALNTYESTLSAGASEDLVLVFQVSSIESKESVKSLVVEFTDEAGNAKKIKFK